jgi:hypothetical protein
MDKDGVMVFDEEVWDLYLNFTIENKVHHFLG